MARKYLTNIDVNNNDLQNVDSLTMNTSTTEATGTGKILWDVDFDTLQVGLNNSVNLQIGQEHLVRVKNASGSVAIPAMTAVMFSGSTGDTVTVSPAVADGTYPSDYFVGITTQEISADGFGFVTQFGFVNNINTDTPGWNAGTLLYVDPSVAGGLTSTVPTGKAWKTPIAAVTRRHASTGRMLVRVTPGIKLNNLDNVYISTLTDGQAIVWDNTQGYWKNATISSGGGNSFTTIATPSGTSPVADSSTDTLTLSAGSKISITGDSSADSVTIASSANTVYYQSSAPSTPATGDVWVDSGNDIIASEIDRDNLEIMIIMGGY